MKRPTETLLDTALLIVIICAVIMSVGLTTKFMAWLYEDLLNSYPSCNCSFYEGPSEET